MPISPSQAKKIAKQPPQGFKATKKKQWDPPNRQTYTVDDLAKKLGILSSNLKVVAATLAGISITEVSEADRLKRTRDELIGLTRHVETIYCRLLNHGVMARQPDTVLHYNADDIPF